ncbi:MAG: chloride channel protein [Propionibacteriaceae bacterium]|jgi:hypothetical protein|nr:chloride channel protein [Propionibacteriaceae bacterium]
MNQTRPATTAREIIAWLGVLILFCCAIGSLVSLFWVNVVELPVYTIQGDSYATISERDLMKFAGIEAWYVVCAILIGPGVGWVAWRWFRPLGWPAAVIAAVAGLGTGVICLWCGDLFGPGSFAERIADADPGELVEAAVELRAVSAVWAWPLASVAPALVISLFSRPDTQP